CVMARQCHLNTCPVGIATQREDLRVAFAGTAEMLIGYLRLVAGEVREILASLGLQTVEELIGRTDRLQRRENVKSALNLDGILNDGSHSEHKGRATSGKGCATSDKGATSGTLRVPSSAASTQGRGAAAGDGQAKLDAPVTMTRTIANTDRAFGADIAGAIAARYGDAGLPDGSVMLTATGSAGQSFGAFALPGMRLSLVGDANDGLGKGMHGGEIVVAPTARERGRMNQVLAGNAALYGATGGRLFVAGRVGERFAVRNSGATAVVEGAGDHACEYMTGGT